MLGNKVFVSIQGCSPVWGWKGYTISSAQNCLDKVFRRGRLTDDDEDFVAEHLSDLESRILAHYASGVSSDCVAHALSVSKNTVNTYIARIRDKYRKSGRPAESRIDLFRRAAEDGLVSYFD